MVSCCYIRNLKRFLPYHLDSGWCHLSEIHGGGGIKYWFLVFFSNLEFKQVYIPVSFFIPCVPGSANLLLIIVYPLAVLYRYNCIQDPNMLTLLSMIGLLVTLLDYAVPRIQAKLFPENSWSPEKERKLENICQELVNSFFI